MLGPSEVFFTLSSFTSLLVSLQPRGHTGGKKKKNELEVLQVSLELACLFLIKLWLSHRKL